jgi:anti-anti-sigma regulatory factor
MPVQIFIDEVRPIQTEARLVVRGQLRSGACDELTRRLGAVIQDGTTTVTIDLAGVTALDHEGFGVLVRLQRFARAAGVDLHVQNAPPLLEHLLTCADEHRT